MNFNAKTAARLINSMITSKNNSTREALRHTWIDKCGRMCACDGFRAYRLNVPVAGCPEIDAEKTIDLEKVYPKTIDDKKLLDLPSLADARAMLAQDRKKKEKGQKSFLFPFGFDENGSALPAVDLRYLIDIMTLFPNARAYYTDTVRPIVFKDDNGDALLMPIRQFTPQPRRKAPAPIITDSTPAIGLRAFAALYA